MIWLVAARLARLICATVSTEHNALLSVGADQIPIVFSFDGFGAQRLPLLARLGPKALSIIGARLLTRGVARLHPRVAWRARIAQHSSIQQGLMLGRTLDWAVGVADRKATRAQQ
jgi:hypothetical protein